jgi:FimV-like protein
LFLPLKIKTEDFVTTFIIKVLINMKKISFAVSFSKGIFLVIVSTLVFAITTPSAIADPLKDSVMSKGTLSGIVAKNYPNTKLSKAQIMVAILATNPTAFRGGNINFMMRNRNLSLPSEIIIGAVPAQNATTLLLQHEYFYQQGKTGNLPVPTLINAGGDLDLVEKLKLQHSTQVERVEELSEESTRLQSLVQRLEAEKNKRDEDLQTLEGKIEALKELNQQKESEDEIASLGTKVRSGEASLNEQRLREKNVALQQQLIESKSELVENNRTTISLERRVIELQEAKQKNFEQANREQTNNDQQTMPVTKEKQVTPVVDIDNNRVSPEENQFSLENSNIWIWILSLVAIVVGLGFLFKWLNSKKHADLNLDEIDDIDFSTPKMQSHESKRNDMVFDFNEDESLEIGIKLDVARAYIEADDRQAADEMLREVIKEGDERQQTEAKLLLATNRSGRFQTM